MMDDEKKIDGELASLRRQIYFAESNNIHSRNPKNDSEMIEKVISIINGFCNDKHWGEEK